MPDYSPPPPTLEHLNPIQRYMQKGELEKQDYIRLAALVLAYFILRPYLHKAAKWFFGNEQIEQGEKAQEEYRKRRLAKISANAIRSGKTQVNTAIEEVDDDQDAVTTGRKVKSTNGATNRKSKVQPSGNKSVEDELLDWDDEPERKATEDDKGDVMQWLDKWDK